VDSADCTHRVRPPRLEPHVLSMTGAIDRPFDELCAVSTLRDRLRAGDVWVAGSRQCRAFDEYPLPQPEWHEPRETGPVPVAIETAGSGYLERRRDEVNQAITKVAGLLARDQLTDVRLRDGRLTIAPLRTTVPLEAEELGRRSYELLRWVRITDLLVEVADVTGMSRPLYPPANRRAGQRFSSGEVIFSLQWMRESRELCRKVLGTVPTEDAMRRR
jgi:hypothetical protein